MKVIPFRGVGRWARISGAWTRRDKRDRLILESGFTETTIPANSKLRIIECDRTGRERDPQAEIFIFQPHVSSAELREFSPPYRRDVYWELLETDTWHQWATERKRMAGMRCQECRKKFFHFHQLHAHHKTYERLGCELDSDIEILCKPCHWKKHPSYRRVWEVVEGIQISYREAA